MYAVYPTYPSFMQLTGVGRIGKVCENSGEMCLVLTELAALKGSDHLDFILDNRLYRPVSPPKMEDMYEQIAPNAPDFNFITPSQVEDGSAPPEQIILPAESHNQVARVTQVPELSGELERAVWQINRQFKRDESQQSKQRSPAEDSIQPRVTKEKQSR
jgi:hypothetical protein